MIIGMLPALATIPVAQAQGTGTCSLWNAAAAGSNSKGTTDPFCVFLHPGAADTYKSGWSQTLDTLYGTQYANQPEGKPDTAATNDLFPGKPDNNDQTRQVFDKYLDYAILASGSDSIGDFQFDFTIPTANLGGQTIYGIAIYVPPEFTWLGPTKTESVWTDITNDYQYVYISHRTLYDTIAPDWTRVWIGADLSDYGVGYTQMAPGNTYHVRLFNLRAPEVAGLYHFKIYWEDSSYNLNSIGVGNYPFVIVKNELNPAWVEVSVRADFNFSPTVVSGQVTAEGTTPEGRAVKGVAYWGPMELDHFQDALPGQTGGVYRSYLFGLAAGTYTLTAVASGYNPTTTDRITINAGQSYHIWIDIFTSPSVSVTVWSKHGTGAIPWHNLWQLPYGTNNPDANPTNAGPWRDILLELYDSQKTLIGFWASNVFGTSHLATSPYTTLSGVYAGQATKSIGTSNELIGLHDDQAPHPTATSFWANLVDNYDLLNQTRQYPSTHWDGHVPWNTADYIAGMDRGQYTVEGFVTGYIMDEADAYQRTFTITSLLGTHMELQFDLRRSNWVEVTMHMPAGLMLTNMTTVTLTGTDVGSNERAAVAFFADQDGHPVSNWMTTDGDIDGADASGVYEHHAAVKVGSGTAEGSYNGGIVIEGYNSIFPYVGGRSGANDINKKDYGLNPTASTHSQGAVALEGNDYTISLYMADMNQPYLGHYVGTVKTVGNVGTGWYNIVGGDPHVSVFLCNTRVALSFKIVNAYVWISLRSTDFEVPAHSRPWTFPGSEVWVEFVDKSTDTAVDWLVPSLYGFFQDPGMYNASQLTGTPKVSPYVGFDIPNYHPSITNRSLGVTPFDVDKENLAGYHEHLGVWYYGSDYCRPTINYGLSIYRALFDGRSTRLPAGEYYFNAYTHGYVMRRMFPVQIPGAGAGDIEADLIQGGQIRVLMDFYHEGISTIFNGFVRVEVFDSNNNLVGASIYGQAQPNINTRSAGSGYLDFAPGFSWEVGKLAGHNQAAQATGFDNNTSVYPSSSMAQRAYGMMLFYGVPNATWASGVGDGWVLMNPGDATRLGVPAGMAQAFDVYGFYWYFSNPARTWAGGWPTVPGFPEGPSGWTGGQWDYGLKGSVDIPGWPGSGGGTYTVKVWAFDPRGPNDAYEASGVTDDWRMYEMGVPLQGIEVPWGGSITVYTSMNNMATLRGTVRWFDMFGNLKALPWAQISASPGPATDSIPAYSSGLGSVGTGSSDPSGSYIMWLPAGTHSVSISTSEAPGVWSSGAPTSNAEFSVVVSPGWMGGGDSQLSTSGTPVPEVPGYVAPLALFAALAASVWVLRKRNLNTPLLMK